jgi:hypothetical protein
MPRLFDAGSGGLLRAPFFSFWDCNLETSFRRVKFPGEFAAAEKPQNETGVPVKEIFRSNHGSKENLLIKK